MAEKQTLLKKGKLEELNRLLRSCAETEAYCKDCHDCHLDVSKERVDNAEQQKIAAALKAKFFPMEL